MVALIGCCAVSVPAYAETVTDQRPIAPASAASASALPRDIAPGFSLPQEGTLPIAVTAFSDPPTESADSDQEGMALPVSEGPISRPWTYHAKKNESRYPTFGKQVGRIRWETLGGFAYFTAVNAPKFFKPTTSLHFKSEGWFGKSTMNLGVDKLTHAFDSYILAELLHARLHDRTDASSGDAVTAALLSIGMMAYSELSDGIETDSGISMEDIVMNVSGAAFSVLRNTVPGLREKLDFRMLLIPNSSIYSRTGKRHYEQQRFLFALKLAGFERFKETPLRFVELHAGYYGSNFTNEDIARGEKPRRHLFFGFGINLRELFFREPKSTVGRAVGIGLDYFQIPYTAKHWD